MAAVLCLAGCSKKECPQPPFADVCVTVDAGITKATGASAADEQKINSLQVLVYDSAGNLEARTSRYSVAGGKFVSETMSVTVGAKSIFAVANTATLTTSAASSVASLQSTVTSMADNALSSFVMCGKSDLDLNSDATVPVTLKRFVCKVVLRNITRNFSASALSGVPLQISGMYLSNIAGNADFACSAQPTLWYNKLGELSPTSFDALTVQRPLSIQLQQGASYNSEHVFYCYPNPTLQDSSAPQWCPRRTRLVVEADIAGTRVYYPVTLPVLERNKVYTVDALTLTRPGSSDPDLPDSEARVAVCCDFSVTVADWEVGGNFPIVF